MHIIHYRKFATGGYIVLSPLNTVCVTTLPREILIMTSGMFRSSRFMVCVKPYSLGLKMVPDTCVLF